MKSGLFALGIICGFAFAGPTAPPPKYLKLNPVKEAKLSIGKQGEAVFSVVVDKGLHIQANPASKPNLIATTLNVPSASGVTVGTPRYPQGKTWRLAGSPEDFMAYDGKVEIKLPLTAEGTAKPGKLSLEGTFRYQACTDQTCFFPITVPVKIPVVVK